MGRPYSFQGYRIWLLSNWVSSLVPSGALEFAFHGSL